MWKNSRKSSLYSRLNQLNELKLTMKYIIGITFLLLFSCQSKKQQELFSPPESRDINDIISAIINQQNLPVSRYLSLAANENIRHPLFCVDLEKVNIAAKIYSSSIDTPPPPPNTLSIGYLQSLKANDDVFFQKEDSAYFLFQSKTLEHFRISKELSDHLTTTSTNKMTVLHKLFGLPTEPYYAISIPIFSRDHRKAYALLYYVEFMNSYSKAIYLEKQGNWKVIKTQWMEVS